jgi:2-octaprenylphenol hydroxylase
MNSETVNKQPDCDVLIVGAGLVGASLALRLADCGLRIGLLDKGSLERGASGAQPQAGPVDVSQFDPRVVALTAQSQRLLAKLGVWQQLDTVRRCDYAHMRVWEQDGTGQVEFHAREVHEPSLGTIVENSLLLNALYGSIAAHNETAQAEGRAPLALFSERSVEALGRDSERGRPISRLRCDDGSEVAARLVIAADGGNSPLRSLAGFETREWNYGQKAIVTTIRTALPHAHTALQRFLTTGPLAYLPLADGVDSGPGRHCSIVWSADEARADELMALDEAAFNAQLTAAMEGAFGGVEASATRFAFPLRQRHAKRYVEGNVVLVGDAAHTIHPLAGQGVNLGLADVEALAEQIEAGIKAGRQPEDPTPLARYQRQRTGPNLAMMALMEAFKRGFGEQPIALRWLRNAGLNAVNAFSPLRKALTRTAR